LLASTVAETTRSTSASEIKAPCTREGRSAETGLKSISPIPSKDSAPGESSITRESTWLETAKAMRLGTLALIMPVITSTLGRWVATTRWRPTARAF
jgi:hypothetical protein